MLKQLIDQLIKDLGSEESLAPNDDGSYSLALEPDIQISLRENPDSGITIFAPLSPLPTIKVEEFLCRAMSANLLGRETGGNVLGLDQEGKRLVFLNFLPLNETYRDFHERLEDFVNYAESWRQETLDFENENSVE